jgi:hypothetical protein
MSKKPSSELPNQEDKLRRTDSEINCRQLLFALPSDQRTEAEFQRTMPFRGTPWVAQRHLKRWDTRLG